MAKMDKKWVILCSSAIAAVYASGYVTTASQVAMAQPKHHVHINIYEKHSPLTRTQPNATQTNNSQTTSNQSASNQTSKTNNSQTTSNQSVSNQTSKTEAVSTSQSKYKDGTYKGEGMNRRGYIEVAVTIKSDKITDVEISNWGMHYAESDVDGLPQEVVQIQSAQVQNVSGATYSTQAFKDAVQDAMTKAENA